MWGLLRRAIVGVAVLVVVTISCVLIVSQTRRAHELVRARVVDLLTQTYQGDVGIGAIRGSFLGDLEIRDIVVSQKGEPILTVPLARVRYALFPLVARRIRLTEIEVVHPRVHLARTADGAWNVASALEVKNPRPPGTAKSGGYSVSIHRLEISDADIGIQLPSGECRLTNTNLEATANVEQTRSLLKIQGFDSRIGCPHLPQVLMHAQIAVGQFRGTGALEVSAFSLKTRASEIDASATVYDLAKMRGQGTVQIRQLAASDLDVLDPNLGFARDLSGAIKISGDMAAAQISAAIAAGKARSILEATAKANGTSYDCQARVSVSGLQINELLIGQSYAQLPGGTIHGTMSAEGNVRDLADLSAEAELHDDAMAMRGWQVGNLAFRSKFARRVATIDAALANGTSRLQLRGAVGLNQRPSYKLVLAMSHVDLRAFARRPTSMIATDLNANADLRGFGIDPKTAEADGTLQWSRSIVGALKIDRGELRTGLSQGVLRVRQALIEANDSSSLEAQGTVWLSHERRVSLNYSLRAGTLSPWLELASSHGRGRLELGGTIAGNLGQLRVRGSSLATGVQVGNYSAGQARLVYDLVQFPRHGVGGEIELSAANVNTAARFKSLVTTVHLSAGPPQWADVSCKAIDTLSRPDQMKARLTYQPGDLKVSVAMLSLATAGGEWTLRRVAEFSIQERALRVRDFELVSGNQSLTIEGQMSNAGPQNLRVSADRVSLASLAAMSPQSVPIGGLLSARVQLSGDAAAPVIDATGAVNDLNVSGLRYQGLEMKALYAARKAGFDVTLRQDASHSLRANGTLPFRLAWSQRLQADSLGDMHFHVGSPGIDIAFLQIFTSGTIKDLQGALVLDISATGAPKDPQLQGSVDIRGASFFLKPLNVDVTGATGRVDIDRQRVRLVRLFASAGSGTLNGKGTVELERYSPRRINVGVSFDKWPAIATHEYRSVIAGALNCSGSLGALQIRGSIESLSGLIHPDISLFQKQSLKPDETIHVSRSEVESKQDLSGAASRSSSDANRSNDVAIDLGITIDRDNWIKTDEAQVELQGTLRARKPAGGPVDVVGTLHTVRGSVSMVGKRFDLARGDINFVGGAQIDPALDILAQDRVQNYLVSANITGSASKPTLSLSSAPSLEQSDILSMVMFGRPVNQLNGSQQQNLQKQAAGIAAAQAGRAIADSLGLEDMGVTTTETGGVGVGRYVTQNIYVSASQETTDPRKRRGSVSYYLTPQVNINTSTSTGYGNQIELQWHKDY